MEHQALCMASIFALKKSRSHGAVTSIVEGFVTEGWEKGYDASDADDVGWHLLNFCFAARFILTSVLRGAY